MMKRVRDLRASDAVGNENRMLFILMDAPEEEPIPGSADIWGVKANVIYVPVHCERHAAELAKVKLTDEISPTLNELESDILDCADCVPPRFEVKRWRDPDALVSVVNHEAPDEDRANV